MSATYGNGKGFTRNFLKLMTDLERICCSIFKIKHNVINIKDVPNYANNAAAIAGGLVVGDVYRISGALQIVI